MAEIGKDIFRAKALLEKGELVAIPTETVYGLAGNALNGEAVTQIFKVKNRPSFDPLIVHTDRLDKIAAYVTTIPEAAEKLAEAFWPGPLTILLEKKAIVPDLITSGLERVALRIPQHELTLQLLAQLSFPLAAPSANPFGYISPTEPTHVNDQLGDKIPYILDGGPCRVGIESTIIGFESGKAFLYRSGGTTREQIEAVIGPVATKPHSTSNPSSPGMLKSHYAPSKPLIIGNPNQLMEEYKGQNFAVLSFHNNFEGAAPDRQINLSAQGNLEEAAQKLFTALRALDRKPVAVILTALVPDKGLGSAINDRLKRAAAQK